MSEVDWSFKIAALLSRSPGGIGLSTVDPRIAQADTAAFALDRLPQLLTVDEKSLWAMPEFVHPLSGKRYLLGVEALEGKIISPTPEEWQEANQLYQQHIHAIQARYSDPKMQYLALWRFLADCPDGIPASIRGWWRLLPADSRLASVSLWEHLNLVSAIAGVETPTLLQFNFAGAQDFIQCARRTQDLWSASYLIAYLVWGVIRFFSERYGPDCILQPSLREQPLVALWLNSQGIETPLPAEEDLLVANIPNIFTAILPASELPEAAEEAIQQVQKEWDRLSERVRTLVEKSVPQEKLKGDAMWSSLWARQTGEFAQGMLFWAAMPIPTANLTAEEAIALQSRLVDFLGGSEKSLQEVLPTEATVSGWALYSEYSRFTARILQDRKHVRDFLQSSESGQKCTLCGLRSALHPDWEANIRKENAADELVKLTRWWGKLVQQSQPPYKLAGRIRKGDRLCAVCLVKRLIMQAHFDADRNNIHANPPLAETSFKRRRAEEPAFNRHQFPSTAGIANASFIQQALIAAKSDALVKEKMKAYCGAIKKMMGNSFLPASALPAWRQVAESDETLRQFCESDGDFLYLDVYDVERLTGDYLERKGGFDPRWVKQGLVARQELMTALENYDLMHENAPVGRLSRYYAIIHMDGDKMGEWVSGALPKETTAVKMAHHACAQALKDIPPTLQRPIGPATHAALSSALGDFALQDARRIVEEENTGKLIYAGGDDVLAMVPLNSLLATLQGLYRAYRGLDDPVSSHSLLSGENAKGLVARPNRKGGEELEYRIRMGEGTLSAGIVIVHEAASLASAMEQARQAEDYAKDSLDRDAFAFFLNKRSGAPLQTGAKWRQRVCPQAEPARLIDVIDLLENTVALMKSGLLSSKLAYTLQEMPLLEQLPWHSAGSVTLQTPVELAMARQALFRQMAARHFTPLEKDDPRRAKQQEWTCLCLALLEARELTNSAKQPFPDSEKVDAWKQLTGLLLVARVIALGGAD